MSVYSIESLNDEQVNDLVRQQFYDIVGTPSQRVLEAHGVYRRSERGGGRGDAHAIAEFFRNAGNCRGRLQPDLQDEIRACDLFAVNESTQPVSITMNT